MLTNFEITDLAKRMNVPLEFVDYKDNLKYEKIKFNKTYIINLQDEDDEGSGTHWTGFQVNKNKKTNEIMPLYFDPIGSPPPEIVKSIIKKQFNKYLNYTTKNIQSIMSNVCGWYVLAWSHFINDPRFSVNNIYEDTGAFLAIFKDLDETDEWKHNELLLKQFFLAKDKSKRISDDVFETPENYEELKQTTILGTQE